MSHQSGIKASKDVSALFVGGQKRALLLSIKEETLECTQSLDPVKDWENDLDVVHEWAQKEPCFVLVRRETDWILFQYVPDTASVRDKMLYASTKNTLTKDLGESNLSDVIFCTQPDEISLKGYQAYQKHKNAQAPLTERELEKQAILKAESISEMALNFSPMNATGLQFPVQDQAVKALEKLSTLTDHMVVLQIDSTTEQITLLLEQSVTFEHISQSIPKTTACYVIYRLTNGETIFVYVSPPEIKIKDRMLYSATRRVAQTFAEETMKTTIKRRFELDSVDEINPDLLVQVDEKPSTKLGFAKPARPGRK
ncbi:hypothetical protein EDD86DRAFT_188057 [Gorgonomyces haynaldii]|nr:hypothetical protein EDD86DRAFT_188057 [Gorgonomyces haynaldii]